MPPRAATADHGVVIDEGLNGSRAWDAAAADAERAARLAVPRVVLDLRRGHVRLSGGVSFVDVEVVV